MQVWVCISNVLMPISDIKCIRSWRKRIFIYFIYIYKVKLSLCTMRQEGIWQSGGMAPCILTLALDKGEWSASHPSCFTPRERNASTWWTEGWVGPRANLVIMVKRKISAHTRNQMLVLLSFIQPAAYHYTDQATLALIHIWYTWVMVSH
jgi:hypothetical protein